MVRKRRRTEPRRDATRRRPTARHDSPRAEDQPLIAGFREALRTPDGIAMLDVMGGIVEATRQDRASVLRSESPVDLAELVQTFIEVDIAETTAALHVIAAYIEDDVLRVRIRRELKTRRQPMPEAVSSVAELQVTQAWRLSTPPGDTDDILLALSPRVPGCVLVHIDCNVGIVADAFTLSLAPQEVLDRFREAAPGSITVRELSPADARARLEGPIDLGDIMIPPVETETWPGTRPLLRMLCRRLPEGGTGYPMDAADTDQDAIVRSVLATRAAAHLDDTPGSDDVDIVQTLVWLTGFLGFFEPLRWSPERADAILLDLVPRKVMADSAYLRRVPEVLTALVRAAAELGHTTPMVAGTTAEAIRDLTTDYLEAIDTSRPTPGDEARRLALAALGTRPRVGEIRLDALETVMGGPEALAELDLDALDELVDRPLDLADAPRPVRDAATAADDLARGAIDALIDPTLRGEYRAAVRTLIDRLAAGAPETLRRGKPVNTAAALCWTVGRANDLLGEETRMHAIRHSMSVGPEAAQRHPAPEPVPVKTLFAHLGVSGAVTSRAATLLSAIGYEPTWVMGDSYALGDPTLLTSEKRRRVALERDRWAPDPGEDVDA